MATKRTRTQLELARQLWQRPYPATVSVVREKTAYALDKGWLTRDEAEVLEILVQTLERSFS